MGRPPNHSSRRRRLTKPSRGRDGHGKRGRQNRAGRPDTSTEVAPTGAGKAAAKMSTSSRSSDLAIKAAHPARFARRREGLAMVQGAPPPSKPIDGTQLAAFVHRALPQPRTRTILLLEGINDRTNRPIRAYLRPDDTIVCVETLSSTHERYTYPAGRIGEERREG